MENDDILVENVLNGNIESFSVIVSKYQNRLLNFLLGLTSCREDAEEILQDVFIRAYNYLYRYNSNWKFSTWIYSIAANSFKDYYNKKKKVVSCQYDYMILSILLDTFFSNNLWFLRWYIMGWSVAKSHYIPTHRFAPSLRCFRILSLIKLFSLYHRRKTTIRRTNPAIVPITHEISPY